MSIRYFLFEIIFFKSLVVLSYMNLFNLFIIKN